jgi:hypothetical protein
MDPQGTYESFESIINRTPDRFKELTGVLPGGVVKDIGETLGGDLAASTAPTYQRITNKFVEGVQTIGLVKAQDVFTKSQEFMYNLDVAVRENLGIGIRELLQKDDAAILMNSKQYRLSEATAMDRTLENILSKSYANQSNQTLAAVAGVIEDARKIPVIGAHVPFGRFFNAVVATTAEYTPITMALKAAGTGVGSNKTYGELMTKQLVAYSAIALMAQKEGEYLDKGIAWNIDVQEGTGRRVDNTYDAPAIALKAAARVVALHMRGEQPPEAMLADMSKAIFGQLTRQLTESGDVLKDVAVSIVQLNGVEAVAGLTEMLASTGHTIASGATRFADPYNALIALNQPAESYTPPDVKTGNAGTMKALRYLDQLVVGTPIAGDTMTRVSPTATDIGRQPGRFVGSREAGPTTASQRVFAMVGQPAWDADLFSSDPVADNIVKREFAPILEVLSQRLLDDPFFMKAPIELKEQKRKEAVALARELTHQSLKNSGSSQSKKASLIFDLTSNRAVADLEEALREMGLEEEEGLHDLTVPQLEVLKYFIENDANMKMDNLYKKK